MKRIGIMLIAFIAVLLLGACGKKATEIDSQTNHGTEITSETEEKYESEIESENKNDEVEMDTEVNKDKDDAKDSTESNTTSDEKPENDNNTNSNNEPITNNGDSQQNSQEQHNHTYTGAVTKEATCSESGIKTYSCGCGASYTEEIAKSNHVESNWQVVSEPTQTADGISQTVCTNCNVQISKKMTPCTQVYENVSEYWAYYEEILALVNALRAEVGVAPVTLDYNLCVAATKRSVEMDFEEWFGHDRPDGRSCFTVIADYGFAGANFGENIASGQYSPEEVVECWKSSSGHYTVMTEARFTKIGVGYCDEWYWHEWDLKRLWTLICSD